MTGEPEQAEAIAPGLTGQHWLEGDHTVLIYGGRPSTEPDVALLTALKKLRRSRPLDGIIWPLTEEQSRQTAQLDKGWRELINGGKRLGFQAPLYLWQVCDNGDYQTGRPPAKRRLPAVGTLYPGTTGCNAGSTNPAADGTGACRSCLPITAMISCCVWPIPLQSGGIAHWQSILKPLLAGGAFSSPAPAWPDVQPAAYRRTGSRTSCVAAVTGLGGRDRR